MKLKEFQNEMKQQNIDLCVFFNFDGDNIDPNVVYFANYSGFGVLGITKKKSVLIVPQAEYQRAKKTSKSTIVVAKEKITKTIKKQLFNGVKKIGIDKNRMNLNIFEKIKKELPAKYVDVTQTCLNLRATKTKEEIARIKKVCKITDEIFQKTFWNFKNFKTESDVAAFMEYQAKIKGCDPAFKTIIASGSGAAEPHHLVENKPLRKGFCVIDFGVKYQGYCSDMTRTVYIGSPTDKEVRLYHTVLSVQEKMISLCKIGVEFPDIEKEARIAFGNFEKNFTHLIGHGLGIEVHENPNPKKTIKRPVTKLVEGSVITIEPGLYYDGKLGIRIEDDILVTKKGPVVLTKTGKNLLVVKSKSKRK